MHEMPSAQARGHPHRHALGFHCKENKVKAGTSFPARLDISSQGRAVPPPAMSVRQKSMEKAGIRGLS